MAFLFILLIVLLLAILFVFSKIRIELTNIKFQSQEIRHLNQDYKIQIGWCVLGIIPIFKIIIDKEKLEKMKVKEKFKQIDFLALENTPTLNKEILQAIKRLDLSIQKLDLWIELGTTSATLTSILTPAIATVISVYLRRKTNRLEKQRFIVNPVYQNQNLVKIAFSGIFEIKMRHIINIIYIFIKKGKKGVKEYERASNRGTYDYSYE